MAVAHDYSGIIIPGKQQLGVELAEIRGVEFALDQNTINTMDSYVGVLWIAGHDDLHFSSAIPNYAEYKSSLVKVYGPGAFLYPGYAEWTLDNNAIVQRVFFSALYSGMQYKCRIWTKT